MLKRSGKITTITVKQGTSVPCFYFYFTTSTNYLAKAFVKENNLQAPAVILAKTQTEGRGRYDRTFLSPKGGVYMSYILKADEHFALWALFSAVAVKRTLVRLGVDEGRISIKWPNDVNVDGKKIAGILPESVVKGEDRYVVIGVGVNVNTDMKDLDSVKDTATSVREVLSHRVSVAKASKILVKEMHAVTTSDVFDEYKACLETIGKSIITEKGLSGVAVDVTREGALVIDGDNQFEVNWGEVCYVK